MGSPIINFEPEPIIDFQLDFQPDVPEEEGLLSKFWRSINTPMSTKPSELGKKIADKINPVESRQIRNFDDINAALFAGMVEGTGDVISNFTSPINAILSLIGLGEVGAGAKGFTQVARAAGMARKAIG